MAVNPQIVTDDVTLTWDGTVQRLPKNTVLDVQPGSALEAAIGAGNLRPQLLPDSTAAVLDLGAADADSDEDGDGQGAAAPSARKARKAPDAGDDKDGA